MQLVVVSLPWWQDTLLFSALGFLDVWKAYKWEYRGMEVLYWS